MNANSFYIAKFSNGEIDRKINLTQRDLTLAFNNGRFSGYTEDDVQIYKINLDTISVEEIPVSKILERIKQNKVKRKEKIERDRQRDIRNKIKQLEQMLT